MEDVLILLRVLAITVHQGILEDVPVTAEDIALPSFFLHSRGKGKAFSRGNAQSLLTDYETVRVIGVQLLLRKDVLLIAFGVSKWRELILYLQIHFVLHLMTLLVNCLLRHAKGVFSDDMFLGINLSVGLSVAWVVRPVAQDGLKHIIIFYFRIRLKFGLLLRHGRR
jgi:hypothetical protein